MISPLNLFIVVWSLCYTTELIILALNWDLESQTHWVSGGNAITTANSPSMMEQKQKILPKEDVRWLMCFTILFPKRRFFSSIPAVLYYISQLLLNVFVCACVYVINFFGQEQAKTFMSLYVVPVLIIFIQLHNWKG